eukprot:NODE_21434_length_753_cov_3.410543.p1 GENE.NODE_21434_length_753_cov_3.410543~~NODE_21434_length_753_cov_3.410543.p1  ORF type:complete len:165 (+),score=21.53 NODE_21434_length_753_cov_3.410543:82-576(+)
MLGDLGDPVQERAPFRKYAEDNPEVTGIPTPRVFSKAYVCDACTGCSDVCSHPDCSACRIKRQRTQMRRKSEKKLYTMCEVQRQSAMGNHWLVAHGRVYDATQFVRSHPAGPAPILKRAGKDCTADFNFHSRDAQKNVWSTLEVGRVVPCCIKDPARAGMCAVM